VTAWEHHVLLAFHSGREADHSPQSSAEVKEWVELYLHSPNTPSWRGAQREHRDNFTFTFYEGDFVRRYVDKLHNFQYISLVVISIFVEAFKGKRHHYIDLLYIK
jgi:hypothetical protein